MGSDELIANLFRISQTEQKLKNENIKLEHKANETHYEVGKELEIRLRNLEERCRKIYQHQIKV